MRFVCVNVKALIAELLIIVVMTASTAAHTLLLLTALGLTQTFDELAHLLSGMNWLLGFRFL